MKTINLSKNKQAIVDEEDYPLLNKYKWCVSFYGYAVRREGKNIIRMHRDILKANASKEVDHINQNKLDNRKSNLRLCNRHENLLNRSVRKDSKTGVKGVRMHIKKRAGIRYEARINGSNIGTFNTLVEAAIAYNKSASKIHGNFAKLNRIEDLV